MVAHWLMRWCLDVFDHSLHINSPLPLNAYRHLKHSARQDSSVLQAPWHLGCQPTLSVIDGTCITVDLLEEGLLGEAVHFTGAPMRPGGHAFVYGSASC